MIDRTEIRLQLLAVLAVAGVMFVLGCGADEGSRDWDVAYSEWDSAGITIVQTSGEVLGVPLPWSLDTVPNLEVGEVEGDGPYQFHGIGGVVALRDGTGIVVVDQGSRELRWFDADGTFLRFIGGEGGGPGEFMRPQLLPQPGSDSILIFDSNLRRFTSVATDGEGFRTQVPSESTRALLAGSGMVADGNRVLFRSATGMCSDDGVCEVPLSIRWVDRVEGTSDTIAARSRRQFRTTELGTMPAVFEIPFDPTSAAAAGPEGPLLTKAEVFEIEEFDGSGTLRRILRIDQPPPELGDEVLDRAILRWAGDRHEVADIRQMFGQMEIRSVQPTFQSLRVDQLGWIWAERFRPVDGDPGEWVVFDPSGRAHGVIELPAGLRVHDIGEDFVLGVMADALGVEHVRRYGLARTGG